MIWPQPNPCRRSWLKSGSAPYTSTDFGVTPDGVPHDRGSASAGVRLERGLVQAVTLLRIGGLGQVLIAALLAASRYPHPRLVVVLIAAVVAESLLLVTICTQSGVVHSSWVTGDVAFCTLALVAGASLTAPADSHSWAHFMYPFTIITCFGIGLAYSRLGTVVCATSVLAVGYGASAVVYHHDPVWNMLPNATSYFVNTIVAWAVVRQLRAFAADADTAHAQSLARTEELSAEREHARHAQLLHDRVLQTMEFLAAGNWLAEEDLRTHVRAEAAWLRAFVEGTPIGEPEDLLTALQALIQHKTLAGMRITFTSSQLRDAHALRAALPVPVTRALVQAAGEALNNVAKHSGTASATVRAAICETRLVVSVLDQGCGFDAAGAHQGMGLERSVRSRLKAVGGMATIDSIPGEGTYVQLAVPLTSYIQP